MKNEDFAALTPEEVSALTGKDLTNYNKWLAKQNAPVKKEMTPREIGEDYFERHPDAPFDSVHVTSDGEVYPGTPRGKNACENYQKDKKNSGLEISITEVSK